ncbi:MAG: WYL domain-containing protein [Clostridia bacterium]|nr:WYL domain-containing protein [Clostridia bacterium]
MMAKSAHQNQKLLRLMQIFLQETDEDHGITMAEILAMLEGFGIHAERKSIYENIETLNQCGMDILAEKQGHQSYYYLASREFETAELRLLADAVASSRFITAKKSDQLLQKLSALASRYQGGQLKRSVHVASRIKNMNETIFYLVDDLNRAIRENRAITFRYYEWVYQQGRLVRRPRHDGALYEASPWQLLWEDEYYYLIAFDHKSQSIHHYRVDRMGDIRIADQPRQGDDAFKAIRMEDYTARVFGMFGGKSQMVTLSFPDHLLDAMIDRFGKELNLTRIAEGRLQTRAEVIPSSHFYGWLFSLGAQVTLDAPAELKDEYLAALKRRLKI